MADALDSGSSGSFSCVGSSPILRSGLKNTGFLFSRESGIFSLRHRRSNYRYVVNSTKKDTISSLPYRGSINPSFSISNVLLHFINKIMASTERTSITPNATW